MNAMCTCLCPFCCKHLLKLFGVKRTLFIFPPWSIIALLNSKCTVTNRSLRWLFSFYELNRTQRFIFLIPNCSQPHVVSKYQLKELSSFLNPDTPNSTVFLPLHKTYSKAFQFRWLEVSFTVLLYEYIDYRLRSLIILLKIENKRKDNNYCSNRVDTFYHYS